MSMPWLHSFENRLPFWSSRTRGWRLRKRAKRGVPRTLARNMMRHAVRSKELRWPLNSKFVTLSHSYALVRLRSKTCKFGSTMRVEKSGISKKKQTSWTPSSAKNRTMPTSWARAMRRCDLSVRKTRIYSTRTRCYKKRSTSSKRPYRRSSSTKKYWTKKTGSWEKNWIRRHSDSCWRQIKPNRSPLTKAMSRITFLKMKTVSQKMLGSVFCKALVWQESVCRRVLTVVLPGSVHRLRWASRTQSLTLASWRTLIWLELITVRKLLSSVLTPVPRKMKNDHSLR